MRARDIFFILCYVILGVLTRTVWHIAPNVEFITALSIASAYFLKSKYSFTVPVLIMIISDLIIGNTPIFLFTWSAFGIAHVLGKLLNSELIKSRLEKLSREARILILSETGGIIFTLFFYLWTNLGVVVVSSMYPKTFEGLLLSYKMGLPFLWPQLVGNMIIVPAVFLLTQLVYKLKFSLFKGIKAQSVG